MDNRLYSFILFTILAISAIAVIVASSFVYYQFTFGEQIAKDFTKYPVVASGKLVRGVDSIGFQITSIGTYELVSIASKNCPLLYAPPGVMITRTQLQGGESEYVLYKGWYWGIGDFYYITPR